MQVTEEVKFEPKVMMEKVDQRQTFHQAQLEHGDILVVQALPSPVNPSPYPASCLQTKKCSASSLLGLVHDKRSHHHLLSAMLRRCSDSNVVNVIGTFMLLVVPLTTFHCLPASSCLCTHPVLLV